ncbi:hypothetical protein SAMN05216266_103309 [Amycolatopsis marina]|uniref:Uncharacterized protein n=1 Tax=Amycolatopsis marina TaxID=490629 RepID=A0A1I0XPC5_9PSEU|nr:hypothetical protein [Amycolatopsis marina]SFB01813.1 hypothetical protein SAMN05216266_103309 [Amycolatopsis marina]
MEFFEADPGQTAMRADSMMSTNFLASGGISARAVEATKVETQKLVSAAKSGGFRISEKGVEPLLTSIKNMKEQLQQLRYQAATELSQAPRLGSHEYGYSVAAHDQKGAAEESGSALVVLDQFNTVLDQAAEALERAAGIYQENEDQVESTAKTYAT